LTSTTPATSSPAVAGRRRDGGHHGRDRGGERARAEISAADPVSGYFAPPRRGHQQGVPQFHRGIQLSGKISRRVSDQGEPVREVVEEILDAGKPFDFGLEVGSKPELFAGLALQNHQGCLIICNGYKDAEFIKMALLGIKLGKKVIMVVEKLEELRQIISISKQLGVEPLIGIRARLIEQGRGQMGRERRRKREVRLEHGGTFDRDGMLKAENLGHCLKLLHFHIGSQVPDILTVKKAVQEAARFYAKLHKMGFAIEFMDVGGGLGVDYDGSRSAFDSSTNYTLQEYTNDIVYYIADVCNAGEGAASEHHQRKRPRHRRASQRADRGSVRLD
jgi:hypothetical protein